MLEVILLKVMWLKSLEKVSDLKTNFKEWDIEAHWDLTMRCNYECSYCESYDNNIPANLKSLEEYQKALLYIKSFYGNKKIKISFLGGEPTLFKQWPELLSFCFDQGFVPQIMTNLSMSLKTLKNKINTIKGSDYISVSWHPSFVPDHDKMIEKIKYLYENKVLWSVAILGDTRYWDKVQKAVYDLEDMREVISISQIYDEAQGKIAITSEPWKMTKEQKEFMYKYKPIPRHPYTININGTDYKNAESLLEENNLLNFKGLYCAVGQKRISILPNGDCYPSVCLYNYPKAKIGNVFKEDLKKIQKPIICPFNICRCGPDIRIEKHKNLEDFN